MTAEAPAPPAAGELGRALLGLRQAHGLDHATVIATVEQAIQAAWQGQRSPWPGAEPRLDAASGRLRLRLPATVVAGTALGPAEIALADARRLDAGAGVGQVVVHEVDAPREVLAAALRVAKAALATRVRAADRGRLRTEALSRRGQLVDGIVLRARRGAVQLGVGPLEVELAPSDQLPGERLVRGQHLKVVVLEVPEPGPGAPRPVRVSRTDPLLLRRMLEIEVPELADGTVTLHAIAREAGRRSKVAVGSNREGVDPIGACVGPRGVRVAAVTRQLAPEHVDIVRWSADPAQFVAFALAPATVQRVALDEAAHRAVVTVATDQLSLAIGRAGQNARLAAHLTGWRIDIRGAGPG